MFCNKCGAMLEDNAKFCPVCGEPVGATAPVDAPAEMPVAPVEAPFAPVENTAETAFVPVETPAEAPAGDFVAPDVVVPPVEAFANPVEDVPAQPQVDTSNANPYSAQPVVGAQNANPYSQSAPQPEYQAPQPEYQAPQQPYGAAQQPYGQQPYGAAPQYGQQPYGQQPYAGNPNPMAAGSPKSKMVAGLLAILIGTLGIHNFYLGYTKKAVIQLLVSLLLSWTIVAPIAIEIWAIIEGIKIFQGQIPDANGVPLSD